MASARLRRPRASRRAPLSTDAPLIASFDVATSTGVAWGRVGADKPSVMTWDLRVAGTSRPRRLLYLSNLCDEFFRNNSVDIVRFEAPLRLAAMHYIGTSEETMLLLRGAIGVLEAATARAGIDDVASFDVKDAREHFVGQRTFKKEGKSKKSMAKDMVLRMCDALGIKVSNDNEADAVAGWSYSCGLANPRLSHLRTPLFSGRAL